MIRSYTELIKFATFEDRYRYLQIKNKVGESTFGFDRYLNQLLYTSKRWRRTRNGIIIRDEGCDLGMKDRDIYDCIIVHHMNPITIEDVELERDIVFDPEFLISTSRNTHNAIHYSDETLLQRLPIERKRNDTCPWK